MSPVAGGEALALDFPEQRFEVAQGTHGLRGRPVDQCHRRAHAAEQDGVPDGFQRHAAGVPAHGETLVGRAQGGLHADGAEKGPPRGRTPPRRRRSRGGASDSVLGFYRSHGKNSSAKCDAASRWRSLPLHRSR